MKRNHIILLVIAVIAASAAIFAFTWQRTVTVEAGEIVECTYGHTVSDTVQSVEVPAREASKYGVKTSRIVCEKHRRAEQAYAEAQKAIAEGDLKTAEKKLAEVVAVEPSYRRAKAQLDEIVAGRKPSTDGATPASGSTGGNDSGKKPSTPGDDAPPSGPVASLTDWMPDTVAGYKSEKPVADAMAVSRQYVPNGGKGESLVIAAEQMGGLQLARDALKSRVKLPYSAGGKEIKINGRTGWIGTDGRNYAVLGLLDGPVLVVIEVYSSSVEPADLTQELTTIAKSLPQ